MQRYLLFDSGCCTCTAIASAIEAEARGWLTIRSLRDPEVQCILNKEVPGWYWAPMLIEIGSTKTRAFAGLSMSTRLLSALGPRRAMHIIRQINRMTPNDDPTDPQRRGFLRLGGTMLAGFAALGFRKSGLLRRPLIQSGSTIRYVDPDYGYSLEYPANWPVEGHVKQVSPYPVPQSIIKRVTFRTPNGLVDVDMWTLRGQDFDTWLRDYAQTRHVPEILTASRGEVAGQDARFFVLREGTNDLHSVFFGDGTFAYRLWNMVPAHSPALESFWHMLDTFTLAGAATQSAVIPDSFRGDVRGVTHSDTVPLMATDTCCGYTCVGNPFDCCVNGNCTWWVYDQYCAMGGVPFRGNARGWWDEVLDHYTEWERAYSPKANIYNIAWWYNGSQPHPEYGHVAFAANYIAGSGTINISEMSCGSTSCATSRTISITNPGGYIRRCTQCPT